MDESVLVNMVLSILVVALTYIGWQFFFQTRSKRPGASSDSITSSSSSSPLARDKAGARGASSSQVDEDDEEMPQLEEIERLGVELDRKIAAAKEEQRARKGKQREVLEDGAKEEKEATEDDGEEEEDEEDEIDEEELAELAQYQVYDEPSPDFLNLKNHTRCPFAKNSTVMNGSKWDPELNLEENVKKSIPLLEIFNRRVDAGIDLDGFLIEIEDEKYGDTVEALSKTVKKVLTVISDCDPSGEHAMSEDLRSNFWNFHFGEDYSSFFISVLAPCYTKNHSRYPYGSSHTFILLQPEISFKNKAIKLDYDPKSVRHLVRKRFIDAGQPYDHRDAKEYTMCHWIVRPMHIDEPPIRWWESNIDGWN